MKKKLTALLLCLLLTFSFLPAHAAAADRVEERRERLDLSAANVTFGETQVWIDPMYESMFGPVDRSAVAAPDRAALRAAMPAYAGDYVKTAAEAAAVLRDGVKAHRANIAVSFQAPLEQLDEDSEKRSLQSEIVALSLAVTGDPMEGDYIRRGASHCASGYSSTASGGTAYITFLFYANYWADLTGAQEQEMAAAADAVIASLGFTEKTSGYDRLRAVYDWIGGNVEYDYDAVANYDVERMKFDQTAYSAIINRKAICGGFAHLCYYMMWRCRIPCRIIVSNDHAWNLVWLRGAWYSVDVTYDSGDLRPATHEFFLRGRDTGFYDGHYTNVDWECGVDYTALVAATCPNDYGARRAADEGACAAHTDSAAVCVTGIGETVRCCAACGQSVLGSFAASAPLTLVSVATDKGRAATGECISWAAAASGGSGAQQYCFYVYNGSAVVQKGSYGASNILTYAPAAAGTYQVKVFVKDAAGKTVSGTGGAVIVSKPGDESAWTYTILSDQATVTGYHGSATSVTVPSMLGGRIVTRIGDSAFMERTELESAVIPEGVTLLDNNAFNCCLSLKSVTLPRSLTAIGWYAFTSCVSLTDVYFGGTQAQWDAITVEEGNEALLNAVIHVTAPLSVKSLTADRATAKAGETVTWTAKAAGGTGSLKYCFYICKDGEVVKKTSYAAGNTVQYAPTADGAYSAKVFVKDAAGTVVNKIGGAVTVGSSGPLKLSSLAADKSTAKVGDKITWTATASGGKAPLKYCFYIYRDGKVIKKGSYTTAKTVSYTVDEMGVYSAKAFVKDAAGTAMNLTGGEVDASGPLTVSSVKADSPTADVGDTITWTASASGGKAPLRYCFYVYKDGKVVKKGAYGFTASCSCTVAENGAYKVKVFVKDNAGTVKTLVGGEVDATAPLALNTVTASNSSVTVGTAIKWTAQGTGGRTPLRYCFYVYKDGKVVQKGSYGFANTFTYTPTAAGKYSVKCFLKDDAGTVVTLTGAAVQAS